MVELRSSGENLDDLQMGLAVVIKQPGSLDPPEELKGVVGVPSAVQHIPDEGMVELRDQSPDRVLQTGGPRPVRHHSTDDILYLFWVSKLTSWGSLSRGVFQRVWWVWVLESGLSVGGGSGIGIWIWVWVWEFFRCRSWVFWVRGEEAEVIDWGRV